ncbi:MAG: hypothetical protein LBJ73_03040 [Rickettsiales bacterium]|jgi:hypothetical protein|nr:hypothetical protein [Rickettsiales bacterium]
MEKIKNFFKTHRHAVIWTVCYFAAMFFVLRVLFGFNLFSPHDWLVLLHARLHGFAGFAFGILLLAAIPMYIASTTVIVRTKKPLFKITSKKDEEKEDKPAEEKPVPEPAAPLPQDIPTELRGAFLRARQNIGNRTESAFDMKGVFNDADATLQKSAESVTPEIEGGLPIPDNFDFSATDESAPSPAAPVFREINFGGSDDDEEKPETMTAQKTQLIEHLESKKYDYIVEGDVVVANGLAIATHADSDFWIADNDDWFAAGKQKASPIATAIATAAKHNATPAIYLAEKNIMDIDSRIADWESQGVTVLMDLTSI